MIWQQFCARVAAGPDRDAIVSGQRCLTYEAMAAWVIALGERLPPDVTHRPRRALVRQRDSLSLLLHVFACWQRGYVAVVLRDGMPESQIAELSDWLRPDVVLDEDLPESLPPFISRTHDSTRPLGPRDEALVICTSGTTGSPKLVALPAESVCITATTIGQALALGPNDRVAVNTPLGYMYGLMGGCAASLWAQATCVLFQPRDPLTQLQASLRRHGITVVQGPPSLFRLFMAYWNRDPFPLVRMVTTGGEPLPRDLAEDIERAFPNARKLFLYGMTEAGPRISHEPFDSGGGQDGCVGVPYPHFKWRIEPIEDDPSLSGVGRFVVGGPTMFLGYINASGGYEGLDAEGYFHSSDLVSVDQDGKLQFRGRRDRIFRSGGRLVNPEAVERVLEMHPAVRESWCSAETHPILGLVPVVQVVMRSSTIFDRAELLRLCALHLEPHAMPRRICSVAPWGVGDSGKQGRPPRPASS